MDALLSELSSSRASDAVADAHVDLHDLQHMAVSVGCVWRHGRLLLLWMEEICCGESINITFGLQTSYTKSFVSS